MRGWVTAAAAVVAVGLGACGGEDEARYRLTTPPEERGAPPLPEIRRQQEQAAAAARMRPTQAYAERMRPILDGWARALRNDHGARAAAYFSVPVIIAQGTAIRLDTAEEVRAFNVSLPCGARLLELGPDGRFLVATFRLTRRPHHVCGSLGDQVRVAVALRGRKIAEWRQMPTTPGAPPGPDQPEDAPPAPPKRIA
jgi:hypothetical protein